MHYVFSTKNRERLIHDSFRPRIHQFMGGIARDNGIRALAVGGVADHAHLLLSLPSTMSVAKAAQLIKGGSSKFMNATFPKNGRFEWQEGYGAFSISASHINDTVAYVGDQPEHHKKKTFEDEFRAFLRKNGVAFDERHLFG
jgi:REP element-mobilizing transposase RayT